jgi:hypothetical protein
MLYMQTTARHATSWREVSFIQQNAALDTTAIMK